MTYIKNITLSNDEVADFIELLGKKNDVYFTLSQPTISPFVINGLNSVAYSLLQFEYPIKLIGYFKEHNDTAIKLKYKQLDDMLYKYII